MPASPASPSATYTDEPYPIDAMFNAIRHELRAAAVPDDAPAMAAYMRHRFPFLGVASVPRTEALRRAEDRVAVDAARANPAIKPRQPKRSPSEAGIADIALRLFALPAREYHYAATWFIRRHQRRLSPTFLPTACTLITTHSWWDTVDALATHAVAPILRRFPDERSLMDEWIDADDLWLTRTAIIHQNGWRSDTDADRLFRYCLARSDHRDFFVRKAIGWALRDYSRTDEHAVRGFVQAHDRQLSGLSKSEALKWLTRNEARSADAARHTVPHD